MECKEKVFKNVDCIFYIKNFKKRGPSVLQNLTNFYYQYLLSWPIAIYSPIGHDPSQLSYWSLAVPIGNLLGKPEQTTLKKQASFSQTGTDNTEKLGKLLENRSRQHWKNRQASGKPEQTTLIKQASFWQTGTDNSEKWASFQH